MNTTILLPTNNRPQMLRTALQSITRQTAVGCIDKIIISENGGSRESEKIADAYANEFRLPIAYTCRRNVNSSIKHIRAILTDSAITGDCVAVIHDDDFWQPQHLAFALQALGAKPRASFYGSAQFDVFGESSLLHSSSNLFAWVASHYARADQAWILSERNMLISQVLGGLCHYSTMVMRTEHFKKASEIYFMDNARFDNDRLIQVALSRLGPVLYNPVPQVFIRQHAGRDCMSNFTKEDRIRHFISTTEWIVKTSGVRPKDIIKDFAARLDRCPTPARGDLIEAMYREWALPTVSEMLKRDS